MDPAFSESLKKVVKAKELIKELTKDFMHFSDIEWDEALKKALDLLDEAEEVLAKTQ